MSCRSKKILSLIIGAMLVVSFAGCNSANTGTATADSVSTVSTKDEAAASTSKNNTNANQDDSSDEMFTKRDLAGTYDEAEAVTVSLSDSGSKCSAGGVKISGSTVTISKEGVYVLSGTLSDGQIVVDADKQDKIQLVLKGANISCKSSAAVYVKQADKVFITLKDGTKNTLAATGEFKQTDDNNVDAAVFSKEDLTLNGKGSLSISSKNGHGVVSKDDLVITGGSYSVTSAGQGVSGKDSVRIADGNITVNSQKDGIHSENTEDTDKGFVYIKGGKIKITAQGDGISASGTLTALDGTFNITAGGGSSNAEKVKTEMFGDKQANTNTNENTQDTTSVKGIKAGANLTIQGGKINVDSADDSVHSNANVYVKGGSLTLATGDDGIHADETTEISGGTVNVTESYEGIEGLKVKISGGNITVKSSDDGINAAGGNDQSGVGGGMQPDNFGVTEDCEINISGGVITVDAEGDGIDSNNSITVSGGELYINGPTKGGNGAIDSDGSAVVTGGVVVAVGTKEMAENFGDDSSQCAIMYNTSEAVSGELTVKDSSGNTVISYTPTKEYSSVVVSSADIKQGSTYTINAGSLSQQVEVNDIITAVGEAAGNGGGNPGGAPKGGAPGENGANGAPNGSLGENKAQNNNTTL